MKYRTAGPGPGPLRMSRFFSINWFSLLVVVLRDIVRSLLTALVLTSSSEALCQWQVKNKKQLLQNHRLHKIQALQAHWQT
jgi:hypothetical protein